MRRGEAEAGTFGLKLPGPTGSKRDNLSKAQCVTLAIQCAFPLPTTGAFTDLLAAIDRCSDATGR